MEVELKELKKQYMELLNKYNSCLAEGHFKGNVSESIVKEMLWSYTEFNKLKEELFPSAAPEVVAEAAKEVAGLTSEAPEVTLDTSEQTQAAV